MKNKFISGGGGGCKSNVKNYVIILTQVSQYQIQIHLPVCVKQKWTKRVQDTEVMDK